MNFSTKDDRSSASNNLDALALMNGFADAKKIWQVLDGKKPKTFNICFFDNKSNGSPLIMICDPMRPVSSQRSIDFMLDDGEDAMDDFSCKIFDKLSELAKDHDIIAGGMKIWPRGMSKEEMLVKMNLYLHV